MRQQFLPELRMDEMRDVETLEQGLAFFESVGMPARNLSTRTRKAHYHDVHNCLMLTFVSLLSFVASWFPL